MSRDPDDLVVRSRADLADLAELLSHDLAERPDEWENPELGRYLEAMAAWLRDADKDVAPSWAAFADALLAARVYE